MLDCYTKAVLTVIAAALIVLAVQNATSRAMAQATEPQRVQICDNLNHCLGLLPQTDYGITSYLMPVMQNRSSVIPRP